MAIASNGWSICANGQNAELSVVIRRPTARFHRTNLDHFVEILSPFSDAVVHSNYLKSTKRRIYLLLGKRSLIVEQRPDLGQELRLRRQMRSGKINGNRLVLSSVSIYSTFFRSKWVPLNSNHCKKKIASVCHFQGAHVLGNADFRQPKTQEQVTKLLDGRKIDCVMSDMAPNATGVRALDHENIITLCYTVLRFAILMSSPNASLLVKIWDNGEVNRLEKDMLKYYRYVKHLKPRASRTDSSERFMLATEFLGLEVE